MAALQLCFCDSICQLLHVPTVNSPFLCFQLSPLYQYQISKADKKGLIDGSLFIGPQVDTPARVHRSVPPDQLTKLASHAARNVAWHQSQKTFVQIKDPVYANNGFVFFAPITTIPLLSHLESALPNGCRESSHICHVASSWCPNQHGQCGYKGRPVGYLADSP